MRRLPWPGRRRRQLVVLGVGTLAVLGLIAVNRPDPAAASGAVTTLTDAQTRLCLDSPAGSGAGPVGTDACRGGTGQQWIITPAGDPQVTVSNVRTGRCLDSDAPNPADPGIDVVTTDPCNGAAAQEWYVEPDVAADGGLVFMDVQTGLILDSNYRAPAAPAGIGAVYTDPGNGGNYQNWGVTLFPGLPPFEGGTSPATTTIQDAQTSLCLGDNGPDQAGAGTDAVGTSQCDGTGSQQWSIEAAGNPAVVIMNTQTGLCLDGNDQNPSDPAVGQVYTDTCAGHISELWNAVVQNSGQVVFMNARTGRVLDSNYQDPAAAAGTGAVYGNSANGGTYQDWVASLPLFPALARNLSRLPACRAAGGHGGRLTRWRCGGGLRGRFRCGLWRRVW
jgi:Ricin-type beta-trefoil lectin domain